MSLITVSDLTFRYDTSYDNVFEQVSFQLDTSWKLGFIGRNGRGKTTFLKLLMGEYAYSGTISAGVPFSYFPFDVPGPHRETGAVLRELCPEAEDWALRRELGLLQVPEAALERPFQSLSPGEQTKALIAALFLRENHFLLLDEPTNHLDLAGRQILADYLAAKRGFILVSHDRTLLDRTVDHVLSINRANIEVQRGNFSSWLLNKERQDAFERGEEQRLKKEIGQLREASRRTANWSDQVEKSKRAGKHGEAPADTGYVGHKAAKMMKRATVTEARRQKALDETSDLLRNLESAPPLLLTPLVFPAERLAEGFDLGLSFDGKTVLENVSFRLLRGDRLVLRGRNGSGKSSLLRALAGQAVPFSGELYRAANLRVSYVPQDASFVRGRIRDFARERGIDESRFRAVLDRLGFARAQFEEDMAGYSAGQKKKVLLAASLCEEAHLYAWDEPLNYLDILSRVQIEDLILAARPTMVLVEHDRAFTDSVGTAFLDLDGGE